MIYFLLCKKYINFGFLYIIFLTQTHVWKKYPCYFVNSDKGSVPLDPFRISILLIQRCPNGRKLFYVPFVVEQKEPKINQRQSLWKPRLSKERVWQAVYLWNFTLRAQTNQYICGVFSGCASWFLQVCNNEVLVNTHKALTQAKPAIMTPCVVK